MVGTINTYKLNTRAKYIIIRLDLKIKTLLHATYKKTTLNNIKKYQKVEDEKI